MSGRLFQQAMRTSAGPSRPSATAPTPVLSSEVPSSSSTPSGERQLYVPKGRREINDQRAHDDAGSSRQMRDEERVTARREREEAALERERKRQELQERRRRAFFGDEAEEPPEREKDVQSRVSIDATRPRPSSIKSRVVEDYRDRVDDDRLVACCVCVAGFPVEMSERGRDSEIAPFVDAGGVPKWIGGRDCVLVYMNETLARKALIFVSKSNRFRPVPLKDSMYNDTETLTSLREIHAQIRPERDSRVANRLIGAALGVRVPRKATEVKSVAIEKLSISDDVPDAWDD